VLQANAVIGHDIEEQLSRITAPTQITFGSHDMVTSTRFANPLKENIRNSELVIFEQCAHAPNYEKVDEFNQRTLSFLEGHKSARATASL
jgi:2-hydroxy-6-oxonona-2,4-dienedioate hydrolase